MIARRKRIAGLVGALALGSAGLAILLGHMAERAREAAARVH
jgi:hypothetical protein